MSDAADPLPRVEVIALGGTIASVPEPGAAGVTPGLTAADLVAAVPGAGDLARIGARNLANVPSTEITPALLIDLIAAIRAHEAEGVAGVVVTQGTDTIEETSFLLDLLHGGAMPVVVTGAMRNPRSARPRRRRQPPRRNRLRRRSGISRPRRPRRFR